MEDEVEISLEDLSKTYQRMLAAIDGTVENADDGNSESVDSASDSTEPLWSEDDDFSLRDAIPTTPDGILEAILFVGHPKNKEISTSTLASMMRGVNSDEIPLVIERLNDRYERCRQAFRVIQGEHGYRMTLLPELSEIKSVFAGKVQTVKLNQQAIDCLALIAYHPGISLEEIDAKWSRPAGSVVRMLIRRNLVELKIEGKGKNARRQHFTTNRFLNLVGISSLDDLPIAWD